MKKRKVAAVFLILGFLLVYLMFILHRDSSYKYEFFSKIKVYSKLGAGSSLDNIPSVNTASNFSADPLRDTVSTSTPQPLGLEHEENGESFQYGIMFDAGSTGTRIHVFKFQVVDKEIPRLKNETFKAISPGLSAYADDPDACTPGIMELLEVAKTSVPQSLWSVTPLVLKATAGLRLLPGQLADKLLDKVRALFQESPFPSKEESVSVMDGTDEGISAWITVNFLTGGLQSSDSSTVGILDLGGGSTQITFSPKDEKTIQISPVDDIRSFQVFNKTHTLYAHSYLGLGLVSVRRAILENPDFGSTVVTSICMSPDFETTFEQANIIYTLKGQKAGEPAYEPCRTKMEKFLYKKVTKVSEAADLDFYAFSYYYDLAAELNLIDLKKGGTLRVSDYTTAAQKVCGNLVTSPPKIPSLCLDLLYISVLLQELGFPLDKELKLARTINDMETSWALGATIHYMETLG
ncbi:ectonucleoside triphosphate diphosphohydrolase 6 isoform X1 [Cynoglossus semilaevis]|uniref:nucleoside diphosphate phosphatase n=1 Tax=Cynoglossus semilaevis TaxID=244447 RepID=A0A3P8UMC2_CYNSE|nr:ectonucleoside triphosphate diphosphohydrolase 6 isoform X1 [Cynoglossus semilaevis]